MAGSFGFEAGRKYEVSMASGERVLLLAVREAEKDTLVIADGFSCREQIAQSTDREALHLVQIIDLARQAERGERVTAVYPERQFAALPAQPDFRRIGLLLASLLAGL